MKLAEFFYDYRKGVDGDVLPESISNIFGYARVSEVVYVMEQIRVREEGFNDFNNKKSGRELRAVVEKYEKQYSNIKRGLSDFAMRLVGKPQDYVLSESEIAAAQALVEALKKFDNTYEHLDVSNMRGLVLNALAKYDLKTRDNFFRVEGDFTVKALLLLGCEDVFGFTKALAARAATENDAMYRIIHRSFVKKNTDLSSLTLEDFRASLTEVMKTAYLDRDTWLLFYERPNGKVILTKSIFEERLHDKCVLRNNKDAKYLYSFYKSYIIGQAEDPRLPVHHTEKIGRVQKSQAIYIFEIIRRSGVGELDFFSFHRVYQNTLNVLDRLEGNLKEIISLEKDSDYKRRVEDFLKEYIDFHPFFKNMDFEKFEAFLEKAKGNLEQVTLNDLNKEASKYTLYGAVLAKKLNPSMQFDYGYFCNNIQGRFKLVLEEEIFNKAVDSLIGKIILDKVSGGTMSLDGNGLFTDTILKALFEEYKRIKEPHLKQEAKKPTEVQNVKVLAGALPGYEASSSSSSTSHLDTQQEKEPKRRHKHKESSSHSERVKEEKHKSSKHHSKK